MEAALRPLEPTDLDEVVALSLRAWAPVFASFERVLGPEVFVREYPDWRTSQATDVRKDCEEATEAWVAVVAESPVGFVTVVVDHSASRGAVHMLAVDPDHHRAGTGSALTDLAVERIRAAGCRLAAVMTGGDPGHAPARRTYERAGFTALPLVHYYRAL